MDQGFSDELTALMPVVPHGISTGEVIALRGFSFCSGFVGSLSMAAQPEFRGPITDADTNREVDRCAPAMIRLVGR
jgi:hypothetical protein